jgi:hypothetical protein
VANDTSSGRPKQTVVDYVTIVLSPALVMGLVGSLVYFLLEVFYKTDGEWKERLQWILFFYVFGAVLTARIAMNGETAARAPLYGAVLAVLTFVGMQIFVEYPPEIKAVAFLVNLLLVGIVWWCSQRLTWDCTNVDEETDMSGEGLLQAAGFEEKPEPDAELLVAESEESKKERPGLDGWIQRWKRYRERKQKKRTLGVWVVYFSMAALPIFGLGQAIIPVDSPGRQFAFWLMIVYVGCGLGLLLTTCFLGLRRYLRQKRLQMPATMTGVWLTTGGTLVVALLLVGAFLPRPYAEYHPLQSYFHPAGSGKRAASRLAAKGDSPGEGKGRPGSPQRDGKASRDQAGKQGKGDGQGKEPGGKDGKSDQSGDSKGEQSGDNKGDPGKGDQAKGEPGKGDQAKGESGKVGEKEKGENGDKSNQSGRSGRKNDPSNTAKGLKNMEKDARDAPSQSSSPKMAKVQQFLQRVGPVLKWIVFAILALVVVIALLRGGLGFLANFTDWAKRLLEAWRKFWADLFGGAKTETANGGEIEEPEVAKKLDTPFSDFSNPFDSGAAARMPTRELVRYTFSALEAWAREHDLGRSDDETAIEFVRRLGEEVPALETEALELANLHARAEYAREKLSAHTSEELRGFWTQLERVAEAPMSA